MLRGLIKLADNEETTFFETHQMHDSKYTVMFYRPDRHRIWVPSSVSEDTSWLAVVTLDRNINVSVLACFDSNGRDVMGKVKLSAEARSRIDVSPEPT